MICKWQRSLELSQMELVVVSSISMSITLSISLTTMWMGEYLSAMIRRISAASFTVLFIGPGESLCSETGIRSVLALNRLLALNQ